MWERGGATISKLQPGLAKRNKGFEVAEPDVLEAEVRKYEEPGKRMVGRHERKVESLMEGFGSQARGCWHSLGTRQRVWGRAVP